MTVRVRCAVYTRKSSEEGLEQSFNSLDAQREACEAYILSQRHEGWNVVSTRYDDGGFSGGNMERPGLKRLLDEIAAKRVDTVVVYKVDRLTRSLADFAKIVEQFDKQGISFVWVLRLAERMDLVSMRMILPNWLMTMSSLVSSTRLMPMTLPTSGVVFKTEFPEWESLKNKSGKSGMFFEPES